MIKIKIQQITFGAGTTYDKVNKFDVSFLCVCPVIDHEFRHNIVKVAVETKRRLQT